MATPRKPTAKNSAKRTARKATTKRKPGRPTDCTPATTAIICKAIAEGAPDVTAARLAGINRTTLSLWKASADPNHERHHERYVVFVDAVTLAEAERLRRLANDSVLNAALPHPVTRTTTKEVLDKDGVVHTLTETVETVEWDWRAGAKLLACYDPEHFVEKAALELTGKGGGAVEVVAAVRPVSGEEQLATMRALEDAGKIPEGSTLARREVLAALGQV